MTVSPHQLVRDGDVQPRFLMCLSFPTAELAERAYSQLEVVLQAGVGFGHWAAKHKTLDLDSDAGRVRMAKEQPEMNDVITDLQAEAERVGMEFSVSEIVEAGFGFDSVEALPDFDELVLHGGDHLRIAFPLDERPAFAWELIIPFVLMPCSPSVTSTALVSDLLRAVTTDESYAELAQQVLLGTGRIWEVMFEASGTLEDAVVPVEDVLVEFLSDLFPDGLDERMLEEFYADDEDEDDDWGGLSMSHGGQVEKVAQCGVERDDDFAYFLDDHGNVARRHKKSGDIDVVAHTHVRREEGYLYYLDGDGDVARVALLAGSLIDE